jgi:hypothetical protein
MRMRANQLLNCHCGHRISEAASVLDAALVLGPSRQLIEGTHLSHEGRVMTPEMLLERSGVQFV